MPDPPIQLTTERLLLRPLQMTDAPVIQRLAGDRAIAATTCRIPHPYEDGLAEQWITEVQRDTAEGKGGVFAVVPRPGEELIGTIGLVIEPEHRRAELGYWIGRPHWRRGYCTEAARAVLDYGFGQLELNRIHAYHFRRNPASGRVLEKIGMIREGCQPQHVRKWGQYEDLVLYGITREQYESQAGSA